MNEPLVLVVDADRTSVRVLTAGFTARGYEVRSATHGHGALEAAEVAEPDVVLLDLGLPDIDGLDVCRHLRARTRSRIIVMSADRAEDRKVAALDLGADDYVTKPFSMSELHARVRVAIRHRRELAGVVDDDLVRVGAIEIDHAARAVSIGGSPISLTPKEYALLRVLARNSGKVLTHRRLLDHVWGPDHGLDTLRTHISSLRRKLAGVDRAVGTPTVDICTESGVGYRLLVGTEPGSPP